MGTKNNPGRFDCYAKLAPDEPYLTLRAKDPSAPYLVNIWSAVRNADWSRAAVIFVNMLADPAMRLRATEQRYDKLDEANSVAVEMREWRNAQERTNGIL